MQFYLFNWLGIVGHGSWTDDQVLEHVRSKYWKPNDKYFVPVDRVGSDGIRPVYYGGGPEIRTEEDLIKYKERLTNGRN